MSGVPQLPITKIQEAEETYKGLSNAPSEILSNSVRLNLGCGDKILTGYINVDVTDERKGKKPDVVCDIAKLEKFADNTVDEILTVHVIEHFYLWKLPEVLQEWKRVLKPGGVLITESPNLLHACSQILKSPFKAALPDAQMSMWPLYGNPYEEDELMCHKWLFTPQTLTQFLLEQGFDEIRQEPCVFKLREPRDFRMVCVKPKG